MYKIKTTKDAILAIVVVTSIIVILPFAVIFSISTIVFLNDIYLGGIPSSNVEPSTISGPREIVGNVDDKLEKPRDSSVGMNSDISEKVSTLFSGTVPKDDFYFRDFYKFSPDGDSFVFVDADNNLKYYDILDKREVVLGSNFNAKLYSKYGIYPGVGGIEWSPDGNAVLFFEKNQLRVFDDVINLSSGASGDKKRGEISHIATLSDCPLDECSIAPIKISWESNNVITYTYYLKDSKRVKKVNINRYGGSTSFVDDEIVESYKEDEVGCSRSVCLTENMDDCYCSQSTYGKESENKFNRRYEGEDDFYKDESARYKDFKYKSGGKNSINFYHSEFEDILYEKGTLKEMGNCYRPVSERENEKVLICNSDRYYAAGNEAHRFQNIVIFKGNEPNVLYQTAKNKREIAIYSWNTISLDSFYFIEVDKEKGMFDLKKVNVK